MGYNYFPDDSIIKNFNDLINFNNHSLVQFYHRNLAYLVTIYICFISYLVLKKKDIFALTVNGDSMIDACITDGDMVLMEPIKDNFALETE